MIPAQERFSLRASVARSMFWIAWSRGALQLLTFATTLLVTGAPAARLFLAHYRRSPRPSARPPQRRTHAEQRHTGLTEPFQPLEKVTSEVPCARTKASAQAEGYSVEVAGGHNLALAVCKVTSMQPTNSGNNGMWNLPSPKNTAEINAK